MKTKSILIAVVLAFLCACKPASQPEAPPPQRACTEIGCMNGLNVRVEKPTPWPAGDYEFVFDLDGTAVTCKGALPLPPCERSPALVCDPAGRVQVTESGCALPAEQHGWGDVQIEGEPAHAKVTIRHAGAVLHEADLQPEYRTLQPNGPDCEPTCRSASVSIAVP